MSEQHGTHIGAHPMNGQPSGPGDDLAARKEMRNAVQWLARVTQSFAAEQEGELRLFFNEDTRLVYTPELAQGTRLGLCFPSLVFHFSENGAPTPHALDVDGRSSTEVEAWLLAELLHRGFDCSALRKQLPYEIDDMMSGDEIKYSSHQLSEALGRATRDLVEAASCLKAVRRKATQKQRGTCAEDLSYWPAHCSIGFTHLFNARGIHVIYEADCRDKHYRVSRRSVEDLPGVEVSIPATSDTEISSASRLLAAIGQLGCV